MIAAMTLYEPVGKAPDPLALAGFVPRESEGGIARDLLRPYFPPDREMLLLAGFDGYERLVRLEHAEGDRSGRCVISARSWRALLDSDITTALMAHNHPSGAAWPSNADRRCTQEAALFLRTLDVDLVDHLIFVASGHFSFRRAEFM
ncbi:DNA repair protein RadC [Sphingopyxis panaciterrae]|uniref:JAB domain-containing protein n=1 Tax=Sphingopyxis panaciterrae TaxID=363841 RepID=UPI001FB98A9E|nr:JAB domain-containing protein [Sphingopyxis panaciterrae]NIJ37035.1 DNA repair protein RadC [Sphingopyxis panaciterrae]